MVPECHAFHGHCVPTLAMVEVVYIMAEVREMEQPHGVLLFAFKEGKTTNFIWVGVIDRRIGSWYCLRCKLRVRMICFRKSAIFLRLAFRCRT